jgi:hypothetical protein
LLVSEVDSGSVAGEGNQGENIKSSEGWDLDILISVVLISI